MIRLLIILIGMLLMTPAIHAAEWNPTTCSESDVQSAITSASDGDTINIPAGDCTWSTGVTVPSSKGLTITGAGRASTNITNGGTSGHMLEVDVGNSSIDISNMSFDDNAVTNTQSILQITATTVDNKNIRLHHMDFYNFDDRAISIDSGENEVYALIDNCTFTTGLVTQGIAFIGEGVNSLWWWDNVSSELGTSDFNFVEDCSFDWTGPSSDNAHDMYGGAKMVARHNTYRNIRMAIHGTDSGNYVSPLAYEFYENTHLNHRGSEDEGRNFSTRGGTGVIYNNTWENGYSGTGLIVQHYRSTAPYSDWGQCDGTSAESILWDGDGADGYPCLGQHGRGADTTGAGNYPLEPIYEWNNTQAGSDLDFNNVGSDLHVKLDREYYNDTEKPDYTAYTYPHPLRLAHVEARVNFNQSGALNCNQTGTVNFNQ